MCKYCKPGNVGVLFEELDFDGTSVFIDNKPDGSILAYGLITPRRNGGGLKRTSATTTPFTIAHFAGASWIKNIL